MKENLIALGIMTGNSLDGVDTVISRFSAKGKVVDIASDVTPMSQGLSDELRNLRDVVSIHNGDISKAEAAFCGFRGDRHALTKLHDEYLNEVIAATRATIENAIKKGAISSPSDVDVIGFPGQTCAHLPPSIARRGALSPYTVQFGDGQELANTLRIPVVYDFRSDDLLKGGEGAPFAPTHHLHLAETTRSYGAFPISFINAGNTGNFSVLTKRVGQAATQIMGWNTGPFNHFSNMLARIGKQQSCDIDGAVGACGRVSKELLQLLFDRSVATPEGDNFLLQPPPRSLVFQWYRAIPELTGEAPVLGEVLSLPDRMRTAQYFAAYLVMYSLTFIPSDSEMPTHFGLAGGGWKNPVVLNHFKELLSPHSNPIILDSHRDAYLQLRSRLPKKPVTIELTSAYGFHPQAMEARIFADAAVHRVWGEPFTFPQTTGVGKPCVCGIVRFPSGIDARSFKIGDHMDAFGTLSDAIRGEKPHDRRFGRATPSNRSS